MNLKKLHNAVAAVCPINGVSVGNESDKATWSFVTSETATPEQIAAAQAVIDAADLSILDDVISIPKLEFKKRLQALGKYEVAAAALASLSEDLKENWALVDCAATDNEPLMALLAAIGVTDLSTIFY